MNLTCAQFTENVSEFLDGELDSALAAAMRAHAQGCARCAMLLDSCREMLRLVGDPGYFAMPEAASRRLRAALEAGLGEPLAPAVLRPPAPLSLPAARPGWFARGWRSVPRAAWAAAMIILVLGAGVVRWRASAMTTSGWLMDSHCYATFKNHPGDHPRACLLKCAGETYGLVDAQGRFHPFDAKGKQTALAALRASRQPDHLWVTVKAERSLSSTLHVEQLQVGEPSAADATK